jgi:chaperone modulatory protein CbpM
MSRRYTEEELIAAVGPLTSDRLMHYLRLRIVTPAQTDDGPTYREIDVRRVSLLCELNDDLDLDEDALVIVMSLLDQLHGARERLGKVMRALGEEPGDVRRRVARHLTR